MKPNASPLTLMRLTALALLCMALGPVQAAVFEVAAGDVPGLAAAIVAANANLDCTNRINLAAGTWTLVAPWTGAYAAEKTGLPYVQFFNDNPDCQSRHTLEIVGAGMDASVIERAPSAPRFRLFDTTPGGGARPDTGLRLQGLTLRGGDLIPATPDEQYGDGAAIQSNYSTIALDRVRLSGNRATHGGAIALDSGLLLVSDSRIEGNSAARGGGAIIGSGMFQIQRSTLAYNVAGVMAGTGAGPGGGGALFWNPGGDANTIVDSTVSNNWTQSDVLAGGGVYLREGTRTQILRSEFRSNRAAGPGGALSAEGRVEIEGSTLSGNLSGVTGGAFHGGDLSLWNVTVANNSVPAGGAAIAVESGGRLHNTIVAATSAYPGPGSVTNCSSAGTPFASSGYNLDSDGSCGLAGVGDVAGFDPATVIDLVARNNGGTSLTHALVPGGLAVDRGDPNPVNCRPDADQFGLGGLQADQRRMTGLQDGDGDGSARCDIGAFELTPTLLTLQPLADAYVRTDLDIRRNDNYGLQDFVEVGSGRGGAGKPYGSADQMRALLRFDLSFLAGVKLTAATLETSLHSFDGDASTTTFEPEVHALLPGSGSTWSEGNGFEGVVPPRAPAILSDPDGAAGVAWAGAADNPDPAAANNSTAPPFEPTLLARRPVSRAEFVYPPARVGETIAWDVTSAAQRWIDGTLANEGLLVADISTDGSFRGLRLGAREGALYRLPGWVAAPRLVLGWTAGTRRGDLSGDGCVDRRDLAILMAVVQGQATASPAFAQRLDLNGDGRVNIVDARALVGLFTNPLGRPCP